MTPPARSARLACRNIARKPSARALGSGRLGRRRWF
jgi:hypothetical protein